MSNSYKKNPIIKENGKSKKTQKQIANRTVRRKIKGDGLELSDGNSYKKVYNSWNIADFVSRWTEKEATQYYYEVINKNSPYYSPKTAERFPTLEKFLAHWKKLMLRK